MANLDLLTSRLLTGGDLPDDEVLAAEHLDHWSALGVTLVIDNRLEWSDEARVARHRPGIAYIHLGVDDGGQRMPDWWFDLGVDAAHAAWDEYPNAVVLAHCHMGINRGPSMAYAILLMDG